MNLFSWFSGRRDALVALSGGVDSALVAYAAHHALGAAAVAVTADYDTLAPDELRSAKGVASEIGIRHRIIRYHELENQNFVKNDQNRCMHCRTELGTRLALLARSLRIRTIVDGTNTDDLGEYRPGIAAMRGAGIQSPLADVGMSKSDVRRAAREAGLSVSDRPSNSCLASRIPWGMRISLEALTRIELAERLVRDRLGMVQLRVRDMGGSAKIEVLPADMPRAKSIMPDIEPALKNLGFDSAVLDPRGYAPNINRAA